MGPDLSDGESVFISLFSESSGRRRTRPLDKKFRREGLIQAHGRESEGIDCSKCRGVCCTFERNKIHISPLEGMDLLLHFFELYSDDRERWDQLVSRLEANIKEYRLDKVLLDRSSFRFRRTYTCPFFDHQSLGCEIPRSSKPYGCLAYGPDRAGVENGESCERWTEVMKERDEKFESEESQLNHKIFKYFQLIDERHSIPMMLLDMIQSKTFDDLEGLLAFLRHVKTDGLKILD